MRVFTIEGGAIGSIDDFWQEIGRAINGPEGYFGRNFDALIDCLRGGFGTPHEPYEIRWCDSDKSSEVLGREETLRFLERRLHEAHPLSKETVLADIRGVQRGVGPTLFDRSLEVFEESPYVNLILE